MSDQFFLPINKIVYVTTIDNIKHDGFFNGFVQFAGVPAVYLVDNLPDGSKKETIILVHQIIKFETTKAKSIIL